MQDKKKKIIAYMSIIGTILILFLIGTFFDLQISKALCGLNSGEYFSSNVTLNFFETFGEVGIYLIPSFSLTVFYLSANKLFKKKAIAIAVIVSSIVVLLILNYVATLRIVKYLSEHHSFEDKLEGFLPQVLYILGSVTISGVCYLIVSKFDDETLKSLAIWSLIVLFTAVSSQIIIHSIKPLVARIRFRTLNYIGDYSYYSPWYKFGALDASTKEYLSAVIGGDAYKSFPSGHTASAAITLVIASLPSFLKNWQTKKLRFFSVAIPAVCIFAVALSRIVIGAHFLSDVTAAFIITFLCYFFSDFLVKKYFLKPGDKENFNSIEEIELTAE